MAYPTDFGSMMSYMAFLMQDTSAFASALTSQQREDLLNAAAKAWGSEIHPKVELVAGLGQGFNFTSAGSYRATSSVATIAEILACYRTSWVSSAAHGPAMEKVELHEMIELHSSDPSQSDTPTRWAVEKPYTTTGANVNRTTLWIHPASDGTAGVAVAVRRAVPTFASTDVPNFSSEELDYICRMAAWDGARLAGRSPEFRDAIIAPLPEKAQVFLRKYKNLITPTKRLEEEPV